MLCKKRLFCNLSFGLFGALVGLLLRTGFLKLFDNACLQGFQLDQLVESEPDELAGASISPTNSQKNLVFVGVMTAKMFLDKRAKAVYETWGKDVPGKMMFFSSEDSASSTLPLVALKAVDDRYPPQKKSFRMLHYMYEHYGDQFEWFIRADDDVFIRNDKLEKFLRSINSKKTHFIGQAGKGNGNEFGLLSLEYDENFCMGGPGIIISRETLKRVAPHITNCLKNLYSTHEDVEVGRCVQKFAGVPCTWSYEMQSILHHNSSGKQAFAGPLRNKEVHTAITLHPVKKVALMYRLHLYMLGLRTQKLRQEILHLYRDIYDMIHAMGKSDLSESIAQNVVLFSDQLVNISSASSVSDLKRFQNRNPNIIDRWDYISKSHYSDTHANPKRKIESAIKAGLDDVIREIMNYINNFSRQRGRVIEFREILYGYMRSDVLHGQDYILDLLLVYKKYRGKKMTVSVRRHLYAQKSFTGIYIREVKPHLPKLAQNGGTASEFNFYNSNDARIYPEKVVFILPLANRLETFSRFLKNFETVCLLHSTNNCELFVALFKSSTHIQSVNAIDNLLAKYRHRSSPIHYALLDGEFSRSVALNSVMQSEFVRPQDIMFFIDVDITFSTFSLDRLRAHTKLQHQIYMPIVFSEFIISGDQSGYYRKFGFGLCAVYKQDAQMIDRQLFNVDIKGWGLEDIQFLEKLIAKNLMSKQSVYSVLAEAYDTYDYSNVTKQISIFRAVDPSLKHIYHEIMCSSTLDDNQMKMCIGTKVSTLGDFNVLQKMFLDRKSNYTTHGS